MGVRLVLLLESPASVPITVDFTRYSFRSNSMHRHQSNPIALNRAGESKTGGWANMTPPDVTWDTFKIQRMAKRAPSYQDGQVTASISMMNVRMWLPFASGEESALWNHTEENRTFQGCSVRYAVFLFYLTAFISAEAHVSGISHLQVSLKGCRGLTGRALRLSIAGVWAPQPAWRRQDQLESSPSLLVAAGCWLFPRTRL